MKGFLPQFLKVDIRCSSTHWLQIIEHHHIHIYLENRADCYMLSQQCIDEIWNNCIIVNQILLQSPVFSKVNRSLTVSQQTYYDDWQTLILFLFTKSLRSLKWKVTSNPSFKKKFFFSLGGWGGGIYVFLFNRYMKWHTITTKVFLICIIQH